MIRYLLDADCAIYSMASADSPIVARIARQEPGAIGLSAISFAEVALGIRLQKPPPPAVLERFLEAIPIVAFDQAAARKYAELPFRRARFDRLLAAHALALGAIVVTNNQADFADVPGLSTENWSLPLDGPDN